MARQRHMSETLIRLQRNVVFLLVCVFFALLFSKPAHEMAFKAASTAAPYLGFSTQKSAPTSQAPVGPAKNGPTEGQQDIVSVITEHCLPKLVCELYSLDLAKASLSEPEQHLVSLIGSMSLTGQPTKFHHAANFGQLIRGVESQNCQNFYPQCPFSGEEVRMIAKKSHEKK